LFFLFNTSQKFEVGNLRVTKVASIWDLKWSVFNTKGELTDENLKVPRSSIVQEKLMIWLFEVNPDFLIQINDEHDVGLADAEHRWTMKRFKKKLSVRRQQEEKRRLEQKRQAEQKKKIEHKYKCNYCSSGTDLVCDVPNGCKNGICEKCRKSGKAKENTRWEVIKRGWITNRVIPVRNGYKCKECSKSKWGDDGSDVGY
jgi:hypothetical protein